MWLQLYTTRIQLDGTTHEQTILCRQLFAGHLLVSRPILKRKKTANTAISRVHISLIYNRGNMVRLHRVDPVASFVCPPGVFN